VRKHAPPTMKWLGACSLNRNNSPALNALKGVPPGAQKFTSSSAGNRRTCSYQSRSVMPTKSLRGTQPASARPVASYTASESTRAKIHFKRGD
jgi:hypothetical protein